MIDGRTHWHGCWREHHDCAVAEVERLRRLLNEARKAPLHRLAEIQMPLPPQMAEALYGDTESLYADSPSPQPRVSDYGESGAEVERLRVVAALLAEHGCDCECGHHHDEHGDDCERCLACRVDAALRGEEEEMSDTTQTQADLVARLRALSQWSGKCEECGGSGEYDASYEDGSTIDPEPDEVPDCSACDGTGRKRCEECGGARYLARDAEYDADVDDVPHCTYCLDGSALPPGAERCDNCAGGAPGWRDENGAPCGRECACRGKGYRVVLTVRPSERLGLRDAVRQALINADGIDTDAVLDGSGYLERRLLEFAAGFPDAVRWEGVSDGVPMGGVPDPPGCGADWRDALRSECHALGIAWEEG